MLRRAILGLGLAMLLAALLIFSVPKWRAHRANLWLIASIETGDNEGAMRALARGANPNYRREEPPQGMVDRIKFELGSLPQDRDNITPLLLLLQQTDVYHFPPERVPSKKLLRLLLEKGANPNDAPAGTQPMVHVASMLPDPEYIQLLLNHSGNPDCADKTGMTPLMAACMWHNEEVIRLLIQRHPNVNRRDKTGETALQYLTTGAPRFGKPTRFSALLDLLLANGADINTRDGEGRTPLMKAADNGLLDAVRVLLARGAKVNLRNVKGETALQIARRKNPGLLNTAAVIKALTEAEK